jgi:hypothetical protein
MRQYPVVFSLPRHGTKGCNNKRFLPRKIEEKEFTLVLWCIITHSSASSHRQQRGRDHPLCPPGVGGNDTRNANEVMKRKRKETCVMTNEKMGHTNSSQATPQGCSATITSEF